MNDLLAEAIDSLQREQKILAAVADMRNSFWIEIQEMRDELLALSNRIEAVTRAQAKQGLYPVPPMERGPFAVEPPDEATR